MMNMSIEILLATAHRRIAAGNELKKTDVLAGCVPILGDFAVHDEEKSQGLRAVMTRSELP